LQHPFQHGFRKNRGTNTALGLFCEILATNTSNNARTNVVLRDISRAFDRVWHDGLRQKMLNYQLPGYLKRIINSYITNRKTQIRINEFLGPVFPVDSGVPQGGSLSPSLLTFYTQDLPQPLGYFNYNLLYADDITQIINYKGSERLLAIKTAQEIKHINDYEYKWRIKTNSDKFQIIPIMKRKNVPIKIDDKEYGFHYSGKVLGLNFSNNGYHKHVKERVSKANNVLSTLYRFRNLSQKNKKKLCNAYVRSVLSYPPIPLHTLSKTSLKSLQNIQNKAVRFILGISLLDHVPTHTAHTLTEIEALNIYLHKQANNIWKKLDAIIDDTTKAKLVIGEKCNKSFQSSRYSARGPEPQPLY
jgi:hypothetical protein